MSIAVKWCRRYRVLLLIVGALLLSSCAPGATTREGRINRIEAFLVDRYNGYDDIKPPNISNLNDAERMSVVNGLSFVVVGGKEQILIDYLDAQWSEWRSADGFMIKHLDYMLQSAEKAVAQRAPREFGFSFQVDFTSLQELYSQTLLTLQERVDAQQIYLVGDSFQCNWWKAESGLYLQSAQFNLVDLSAGEAYSVSYADATLAIERIEMRDQAYGNPSLAEVALSVDEQKIAPLLEAVEGDVLSVSLTLQRARLEGDLSALKKAVNYRQTNAPGDAEQIGRLTIKRQLADLIDSVSYALYIPSNDD